MADTTTKNEYQFPFRLTTAGEDMDPATANAADAHLLELQALTQTSQHTSIGNVLAVITFGSDFEQGIACDGRRWGNMQIRMSYDKLISLGSSKINEMFEPRRQQRIRRRLGFALLPPGIEYVLDFTPPAEGAELATLTASLWLPRMVKIWFLAGHYLPEAIVESGPSQYTKRPLGDKAVGAILALGHDDVCRSDACMVDLKQWQVDPSIPGIVEEDPLAASPKYIPQWRKIEDYCRVRHRVTIMRVLRAINGCGLLINSATRMWTVAQVAIHLEVPRVVVDPITQWLIAPPNTKFIEICPEKAFQLAYGLKIPDVLITSFRILVSELAVDCLASKPTPQRPKRTWVNRKRDEYGDFPSDPVDYASRAFAERISTVFEMLMSDDVFDRLCAELGTTMPQWERLRDLGPLIRELPNTDQGLPDPLRVAYDKLVAALVAVFRRTVAEALDEPIDMHLEDQITAQRKHYQSDREIVPIATLYPHLNDKQKALTPFFWNKLRTKSGFGSYTESTYQGKQLWRIAIDFNHLLSGAVALNSIDLTILIKKHMPDSPPAYATFEDFDIIKFTEKLFQHLGMLSARMSHRDGPDCTIPLYLSDHLLLSLNESELNYLPIWAGGLDDGSGGVFQDAIPPTDMGPSEPGPSYHTGHTVGTETSTMGGDYASTVAPSDLGIGHLGIHSDDGSVVHSMDAQQSVTTGIARGRVVAAPESLLSEQFSAEENEYADARFAQPAEHQTVGQALARYVEDMTDDGQTIDTDRDMSWVEEGDDIAFSELGSVTGAAIEAPIGDGTGKGKQPAISVAPGEPSGGVADTETASADGAIVDGFGLENDDEMPDFDDDDDDDDDTSTLNGSEFDLI